MIATIAPYRARKYHRCHMKHWEATATTTPKVSTVRIMPEAGASMRVKKLGRRRRCTLDGWLSLRVLMSPPVPDGIQFGAVYPLYTEEALEEDSEEDSEEDPEEDPEEDSDDEDQYPSHYSSVKDYTSMAIDQYNADNNAKLELVRIKKVNYGLCCGYNYYITILAKDTISGEVKTLQAKAYHCIFKADRSLTFVRLAPGQQ
ncbi:unnamed protein product [Cuscuta epithymum]|uniref:Cystatin domain-containing protein n=1 Tax=Cuscuta epithymum TaxID=186058 RepID=A0AAV0F2E5_9ASTE|nr:unnamed protein product [Cuscuta epithymum]CAH9129665.1 unnamed protein product [Cuscuta epithymum]